MEPNNSTDFDLGATPWHNLPAALRSRAQWLLAGPNEKGDLKVPLTVDPTGRIGPGSSTNAATWMTFEDACDWAAEHGTGIGYVLADGDPYTCIDLDVKPDTPPELLQQLQKLEQWLESYSEHSIGGLGVHVWVEAKFDGPGSKRRNVEVYCRERFIACTGHIVRDMPIQPRQARINELLINMRGSAAAIAQETPGATEVADAVIFERLRAAGNAEKFEALWSAQWQALGYPSQSEADMALVEMLSFAGTSGDQLERLFLQSGLGQRDKAHRKGYIAGMARKARQYRAKDAQAQAHGAQVVAAWQQARNPGAGAPQTALAVPGQPGGPADPYAPPPGMVWLNGDWAAAGPFQLPPRTLVTRTADTVALEAMAWLWPGFLACKFLNLVVGETSAGKSTVIADIAARITTGRPWPGEPDNTAPRQLGRVLWLGSEDPMGLLTVPRLMACGADLRMVTEIQGVTRGGDARSTFSMQDDLAAVRQELAQARAAGWPFAMLVIDPITSYLSGGKLRKVDMNDSGQLRTVLEPWTVLAEETGIAIVAVTHLAKDTTRSLLHRVLGGGAFAQLCRSLLAVVNRQDEGPYEKALLQVKSNLPDARRGAWRFATAQKVAGHTPQGQPVQANYPEWSHFDPALLPEDFAGGARGPTSKTNPAFRMWLKHLFAAVSAGESLPVSTVMQRAVGEGVVSQKWWNDHSGEHLEKRNEGGQWLCRPMNG